MTDSRISLIVMRRVRTIRALSLLVPLVASGALFLFALWGIGKFVWVAKVFENMPALSDVPGVVSFYAGAFIGTDFVVQVLCLLAVGSVLWLASAVSRILRPITRFA